MGDGLDLAAEQAAAGLGAVPAEAVVLAREIEIAVNVLNLPRNAEITPSLKRAVTVARSVRRHAHWSRDPLALWLARP